MFRFWFWQWGDSAIQVPTVPGLEYTLDANRHHNTIDDNRMHFTLDDNRMHFTLDEED